jgi:hypothetical protein
MNSFPLLVEAGSDTTQRKEGAPVLGVLLPCECWAHSGVHLQACQSQPVFPHLPALAKWLWTSSDPQVGWQPSQLLLNSGDCTTPSPRKCEAHHWKRDPLLSLFFLLIFSLSPTTFVNVFFHFFLVTSSLSIVNISFLILYLFKLLCGFFLLIGP